MNASEVSRAVAATTSIARSCGLPVDDAAVVHNSNKLSLRLLPCNVFARVAHAGREVATFEIEVAQALARFEGCPIAALDPRVAPQAHLHDGFVVTFWVDYGPQETDAVPAAAYADALFALHAGMREVAVTAPHFTDRVAEAQELLSREELTPALPKPDRELLLRVLEDRAGSIIGRPTAEQLLHGEPHPGNLLDTATGPRFIDLETCCRGPVEFDLAHVPEAASDPYPDADPDLLGDCRALVLAMVSAWRWDANDEFPDRQRAADRLLVALRGGPPWPALDRVMDD